MLTLCVNLRNNCCNFVAFPVFTSYFFAYNVLGDARQVNQAIDAAVQADENAEVSDGFSFTFNMITLIMDFHEPLL